MSAWDLADGRPRKKVGRPPGRKNSIRYREGVAREMLKLVIPVEASEGTRALGEQARTVLEKAIRSEDPLAFCKPRVLAALYVLGEVGARKPTIVDLLADMK